MTYVRVKAAFQRGCDEVLNRVQSQAGAHAQHGDRSLESVSESLDYAVGSGAVSRAADLKSCTVQADP